MIDTRSIDEKLDHIDLKNLKEDKDYILPIANNVTPYPMPYKIEKEKYQFKEFSSYKNVQDARTRGEINKGDFIRIRSEYGNADTICVSIYDNIAILSGITQDDNDLLMYIVSKSIKEK